MRQTSRHLLGQNWPRQAGTRTRPGLSASSPHLNHNFRIGDDPGVIAWRLELKCRVQSLLWIARFSSRWAHAVGEPPVLAGLNRHWPDTLANGAMAHMSSLVFFAGYDGFRSTLTRRTLISRLWNQDLRSRSRLRAPRSVIEIRRCVPT